MKDNHIIMKYQGNDGRKSHHFLTDFCTYGKMGGNRTFFLIMQKYSDQPPDEPPNHPPGEPPDKSPSQFVWTERLQLLQLELETDAQTPQMVRTSSPPEEKSIYEAQRWEIDIGFSITKLFSQIDTELATMYTMFGKNDQEWFGEIDAEETKMIQNFERRAYRLLQELEMRISGCPPDLRKLFLPIFNGKKQAYLRIVVGIGDQFEWSAGALKETEGLNHALEIATWMFAKMTPKEALQYLKDIHAQIDENNWQSDSVKHSYGTFTKKLHELAYAKCKSLSRNERKARSLELAKIITGRGNDIDDDYRDPELAESILVELMNGKEWVFEKILQAEKIEIVDDTLAGSPTEIVARFANIDIQGHNFLDMIGFSDVRNITGEYKNLSPEQKIKVSTLSRVLLEIQKNPKLDVVQALQEITVKTASELYEPLCDILGQDWHDIIGKKSSDYGLSGIDGEIFDVYQNINGAWLFSLADTTVWNLKAVGKMGAVIALSIAAGIAVAAASPVIVSWIVASAIVTGIAVWVTAAVSSNIIYQNGYDTKKEAVIDVGSDVLISAGVGAIGVWAAAKFIKPGNKALFSMVTLRNTGVNAWDSLLGMGSEYARKEVVLWQHVSLPETMKLGWPLLAMGVLLWAKAPRTRASMEKEIHPVKEVVEFSKKEMWVMEAEAQRNATRNNSKNLTPIKPKWIKTGYDKFDELIENQIES